MNIGRSVFVYFVHCLAGLSKTITTCTVHFTVYQCSQFELSHVLNLCKSTHNLSRDWCVTIMKIILVSLFIHTRKKLNEKYGYFPAILKNLGELIGLSLFVNQSIQILRIELFSSIWCYTNSHKIFNSICCEKKYCGKHEKHLRKRLDLDSRLCELYFRKNIKCLDILIQIKRNANEFEQLFFAFENLIKNSIL